MITRYIADEDALATARLVSSIVIGFCLSVIAGLVIYLT